MIAAFVALLCAWGALTDSVGSFPDWMTPAVRESLALRVPPPDSAPPEDGTWYIVVDSYDPLSSRDSLVFLNVNLHPIMSALVWPIQKVVDPLARFALEPIEAPALYAEREDVVDRAVRLVRIDAQGKVMVYPTLVMDGGTGSRLGGTYIHKSLLGRDSYTRLSGAMMITRDWYMSLGITGSPVGRLKMLPRFGLSAGRSGEQGIWVPGVAPLGSGQSSFSVREERRGLALGWMVPVGAFGAIEPNVRFSAREISDPARLSAAPDTLPDVPWFANGDRGVQGGVERSVSAGFVWGYGDANFAGTPSEGGSRSMALLRSWNRGGGDNLLLHLDLTRYFLLGDEKYGYRKGDLDSLLSLSPRRIMASLDPTTLRKRLTQRRILAMNFVARRMWEIDPSGQAVSFYNFPGLGGDSPARAYGGRRLLDHAVIGGTLEYRWPIWKFIDGAVFTELAWAGDTWWTPNRTGLAPGAGLGLRVRTPSEFLFRAQFAYGLEGPRLIMTVSPEF